MKIVLLLALIVTGMGLKAKDDPLVLQSASISLQDLLDKVNQISNELINESTVGVPIDLQGLQDDNEELNTDEGIIT